MQDAEISRFPLFFSFTSFRVWLDHLINPKGMWWIHRAFQKDAEFGKAAEQRQWNPACHTLCAAEKKTRKQNNLLLVFPRCKGEVESNFYLLNFFCLHWFHPSPLGTFESGISWFWWDFVGICMTLNFFNKDDVGLGESIHLEQFQLFLMTCMFLYPKRA